MKCTIQSIADELELSRNTVARVLSGKDGVSAKTRKLVLRKAEELGYGIPASSLPKKQLPQIPESIVFLTDFSLGTPEARAAVIQAAEEYIKKQNYSLVLAVMEKESCVQNNTDSSKKEPQLPAVLYSPSVRGVCLVDIRDEHIYHSVLQLNLPTAAVFSSDESYDPEHLIKSFREKIDIVSAAPGQYRASLTASFSKKSKNSKASVRSISKLDHLPKLLQHPQLPDIFLCEDDWTAIRLIQTAQAAGYSVPGDFSVIGCGNIPESAHVFPSLTTIQIPWNQMGTAAARCIVDRIKNPEFSCMDIRFTSKLIERESAHESWRKIRGSVS